MRAHARLILGLVAAVRELRAQRSALKAQVGELQGEVGSLEDSAAFMRERQEWAEQQRRRDVAEAQQRASDAEYRDYQRSEALTKIERARSRGDKWGEERALRDLKSL